MLDIKFPPRATTSPLIVYLDSSDYSNLSRAIYDGGSEWKPTLDKLLQLVETERIRIVFSAVHVIEIAHLDSSSLEFALQRAKCINLLSQGRCLQFWLELQNYECQSFVTEGGHSALLENGRWCPDISELAKELREIFSTGLKSQLLENAGNRAQRRQVEKELFKNGKLTPKAMGLMQSIERKELIETVKQEFPLSDKFYTEDLLLKFAAGKVTSSEIIDEFYIVFSDIERFIGWTYETRDADRKTTRWLRSLGESMQSNIANLRHKLETIEADDIEVALRQLDSVLLQTRQKRLKEIQSQLPSMTRRNEGKWTELLESPLGTVRSLDAHLILLKEYFRRAVQTHRKIKASDAGDLFHLTYLPYCDLFRTDGDASETAKPLAAHCGTRIVSKLSMLSSAIDEELIKRRI